MNLTYIVDLLFSAYTVLLFVRIVTSWFPALQGHHLIRFVAFYTDPYLNFFRRILPPLGGRLDVSPILAFFALQVIEMLLKSLLR
ncbi:MAG: YggT family protein [Chlamydiales bacterium]